MTDRTNRTSGGAGASGPVIQVDGVSKWFGNVVAVSDISFDVQPGITGLLGPNGAGKTTLLRMVCGLASPSEGKVTVFGKPARSDPALYERIGVMREHEAVYEFLTGRQFVEISAKLRGVQDVAEAARWAIDAVNLVPAADRKMGTYSRGMRQRIRLAASMIHNPGVADPRRTAQRRRPPPARRIPVHA